MQVIARFYWGSTDPDDEYQYPGPWVSFTNITKYREWAREIRRVRPYNNHGKRTQFEYSLVDNVWTAAGLLDRCQRDDDPPVRVGRKRERKRKKVSRSGR